MKLSHNTVTHMPFDPGGLDPDSPPTNKDGTKSSQLPMFHPSNLVGFTFLPDPQEDGQRLCTCIVKALKDHDAKLHQKPEWFKFCCSINNDQYEEILSYHKILNYVEQQDNDGTKVWKFCCITVHESPLKPSKPSYKGSKYNIMVEWENGEIMSEPLTKIAADDLSPAQFMPKKMASLILTDGNSSRA